MISETTGRFTLFNPETRKVWQIKKLFTCTECGMQSTTFSRLSSSECPHDKSGKQDHRAAFPRSPQVDRAEIAEN